MTSVPASNDPNLPDTREAGTRLRMRGCALTIAARLLVTAKKACR